jgi:hypothetical protein
MTNSGQGQARDLRSPGAIVKQGDLRVVKRLEGKQCDNPGTTTPDELRKRCVAGSIEASDGIGDKKGDETPQTRCLAKKRGGHNGE